MTNDRFRNFCIVGVGGHARTKLIPAIEANGQRVVAVVSSQPAKNFPGARVFPRLEEAVESLPRDTVFFVATPPSLHFAQATLVLQGGFDLFLEKPAFVTRREAEEISALCARQPAVLVEGFMHRHTWLYREMHEFWTASIGRVRRIEITFLIDKMPAGTFRLEPQIASSAIYDIGCYPVSLLADIGLGEINLEVSEVRFAGNPNKMRTLILGSTGATDIVIDIGVAETYANSVCLHLSDGETVCFSPFFYGRKGERSITTVSSDDTRIRTFTEQNAFEIMLARPRHAWLGDQGARLQQMIEVAGRLEELAIRVASAS